MQLNSSHLPGRLAASLSQEVCMCMYLGGGKQTTSIILLLQLYCTVQSYTRVF